MCKSIHIFTLQPDRISLRQLSSCKGIAAASILGYLGFSELYHYLVLITKYFNDMPSRIYFCFGKHIRMINSSAKKSKLQLSSEVVLESLSP